MKRVTGGGPSHAGDLLLTSLLRRLINKERSCHRDIERRDLPFHRYTDTEVTEFSRQRRDALPFRAHDDDQRPLEIGIIIEAFPIHIRAHDPEAFSFSPSSV